MRDSLARVLPGVYARIPLGMRVGLGPMREACARLGHPERFFGAVHVAGTNGKGSTCAMVEAIARAEGLRTGLYTSPHLCRFAERIRIDGEPIDDDFLADVLSTALADPADLSFFETATAAAFLAFRTAKVDLGIVEVGLGGRLDATNVIPSPRACAITGIALDHTDRLGATLIEIAREKAGIAKTGVDIVLGPLEGALRFAIDEVARAHHATTSSARDVLRDLGEEYAPRAAAIGLAGRHQEENAAVAAVLGHRVGASAASIARGLSDVHWPGRLERIGPYLLDAAHNPDGAASLARYVTSLAIPKEGTALIFGALSDKDWRPMLEALSPLAATRVYVAPRAAARAAVDPGDLAAFSPGLVASGADAYGRDGTAEALAAARGQLVIVAGSIVLVGDVRAALLGLARDPPVAL